MLDKQVEGQIIQCHIDIGDPETFIIGRVVWMNEMWFLIQLISPHGRWDGYALYLQADVVAVQTDSEYLRKIKFLNTHRHGYIPSTPEISNNALVDLLSYAKSRKKLVGIELYMSGYRDVIGFVDFVQGQTICIQQVDEYGKPDGFSYIAIDAITRCYIDDDDLNCLELIICRTD